MVRRLLVQSFQALNDLLLQPIKVLWLCLGLAFINLIADQSLLQLWTLHQDQTQISADIARLSQATDELKANLRQARDPAFLEREARERFDLVGQGDLVFVFSEDE